MTKPDSPTQTRNVDAAEVAKFTSRAPDWWDATGPFATLHAINPLRLNWIDDHVGLRGCRVLDVGCGAGILSEAMALRGADVIGIDAGSEHLDAARGHAKESGVTVAYHQATAEEYAEHHAGSFDIVTCMEMLEHVPDPDSAVAALARLLAPGGHLFLSTINRTPRAFFEAIVGAEYVLRLLPAGTHEYARFLRPSELAAALRTHGLDVRELRGLTYSPITRRYRLTPSVAVNYLLYARRPDAREAGAEP